MSRPSLATVFVTTLLFLPRLAAGADPPAALERAKALLSQNDGRSAAEVLESALTDCSSADRGQLLDLLRNAYETAGRQAVDAGETRAAETYRDNLAILNRRLTPRV